jgi:hypothetical protein
MSDMEQKFRAGQVVALAGEKRPATVLWYVDAGDQVLVSIPHGGGSKRLVVSESELTA